LDAAYGVNAAQARLLLTRGDTDGALGYFRQLPDSLLPVLRYFERFDWARTLAARRQYRDAARVLDAVLPPEYTPTVSEVIWWNERARLATRLADREMEVRGYTLVSRAWAKADPDLRQYAVEAERALRPAVVASR
jgi:outer membrane PBP1 activator LpoA protein